MFVFSSLSIYLLLIIGIFSRALNHKSPSQYLSPPHFLVHPQHILHLLSRRLLEWCIIPLFLHHLPLPTRHRLRLCCFMHLLVLQSRLIEVIRTQSDVSHPFWDCNLLSNLHCRSSWWIFPWAYPSPRIWRSWRLKQDVLVFIMYSVLDICELMILTHCHNGFRTETMQCLPTPTKTGRNCIIYYLTIMSVPFWLFSITAASWNGWLSRRADWVL